MERKVLYRFESSTLTLLVERRDGTFIPVVDLESDCLGEIETYVAPSRNHDFSDTKLLANDQVSIDFYGTVKSLIQCIEDFKHYKHD